MNTPDKLRHTICTNLVPCITKDLIVLILEHLFIHTLTKAQVESQYVSKGLVIINEDGTISKKIADGFSKIKYRPMYDMYFPVLSEERINKFTVLNDFYVIPSIQKKACKSQNIHVITPSGFAMRSWYGHDYLRIYNLKITYNIGSTVEYDDESIWYPMEQKVTNNENDFYAICHFLHGEYKCINQIVNYYYGIAQGTAIDSDEFIVGKYINGIKQ